MRIMCESIFVLNGKGGSYGGQVLEGS
jgi:hypothetical protein